jgi:hypothetical protein
MGVHRTIKQMGKHDSKKRKKIVTFDKWLTMTPNGLGINQSYQKHCKQSFQECNRLSTNR